jgi:hypothetical protein
MEPKEKQLWDAMCLLMLIADSESARKWEN